MTDEISDKELEQLRAKWGIPDVPQAEAAALAKVRAQPAPKKVLVRKERIWGFDELHYRFFFIPVAADGTRGAGFSTTHAGIAKQEAERYTKLGVPMEVMKEIEFE